MSTRHFRLEVVLNKIKNTIYKKYIFILENIFTFKNRGVELFKSSKEKSTLT